MYFTTHVHFVIKTCRSQLRSFLEIWFLFFFLLCCCLFLVGTGFVVVANLQICRLCVPAANKNKTTSLSRLHYINMSFSNPRSFGTGSLLFKDLSIRLIVCPYVCSQPLPLTLTYLSCLCSYWNVYTCTLGKALSDVITFDYLLTLTMTPWLRMSPLVTWCFTTTFYFFNNITWQKIPRQYKKTGYLKYQL